MKIAINGFGRIGRTFYRAAYNKLDIAAVNDLGNVDNLRYLLKYDTIYGIFEKDLKAEVLNQKDPANLPWNEKGIDLVVESTGAFTKKEDAQKHIQAGAKKVIITAPSEDADITIVPGVNDDKYDSAKHQIISMGSCTTNCIVPVVKVINDNFGIEKGSFTTIHSYTANQALVDGPNKKDVRRGRSAAENIIPTTTGAAKSLFQVFPDLKGKIDAIAVRVPSATVSMIDFICKVKQDLDKEKLISVFRKAEKSMNGAISVSNEPKVSTDYRSNPNAAIIDEQMSCIIDNNLIHIIVWYDNEMGYAYRLVEMCKMLSKNF